MMTGLDELGTVVKYLAAFGVPEANFAVDLTIARGLDYYTGTVYETLMVDHPEIGSICSGGRYDNLAEYYTDKVLPGVGIYQDGKADTHIFLHEVSVPGSQSRSAVPPAPPEYVPKSPQSGGPL